MTPRVRYEGSTIFQHVVFVCHMYFLAALEELILVFVYEDRLALCLARIICTREFCISLI